MIGVRFTRSHLVGNTPSHTHLLFCVPGVTLAAVSAAVRCPKMHLNAKFEQGLIIRSWIGPLTFNLASIKWNTD